MTEPAAMPVRKPDWNMIAVLLALFVQTLGIVWWASGINSRVGALEAATGDLGKVAVLEERTQAIREGVNRIEQRLDREGIR